MAAQISFIIALVIMVNHGVEALVTERYCFQCLTLSCPWERKTCQKITDFVKLEMKKNYDIKGDLELCPKDEHTYDWRLMQLDDVACKQNAFQDGNCGLGHIKIKLAIANVYENRLKVGYMYGTMFGCVNPSYQMKFRRSGNCSSTATKFPEGRDAVKSINLDHCWDMEAQCTTSDYCVSHKRNQISPWEYKQDDPHVVSQCFKNVIKSNIVDSVCSFQSN